MSDAVRAKSRRASRAERLDALADEWKDAPRRWGHPLHGLCSYFAMFPPHIPRVFIEWLTAPGDIVFDPFSGRGTAPMEACRLGRIGLGADANPLATVLTGAKVDPPAVSALARRLTILEGGVPRRGGPSASPDIAMLYGPKVLRQLTWLRSQLDVTKRTDRFIMATVLGLLHANYAPGSPARGFSISMPNTFSMSPAYVRRYIAEHRLQPPDVDVFEMILRKARRMSMPSPDACRGRAWLADATNTTALPEGRARLVFTSPPYLGVIKYGKYNWIRLWMLGCVPRDIDNGLMATNSPTRYLEFQRKVLAGLRRVVHPKGFVCLMIGDVRDRSSGDTANLADVVWQHAAKTSGWRRLGVLNDQLPQQQKVSRIWGHERRGQATKVDRILILAPPGSNHTLPPFPRNLAWDAPADWAQSLTKEA